MPDRDLMQSWRPGLSGTDPQVILEQLTEARSAVIALAHRVRAIDINARDYAGRAAELADDLRQRIAIQQQLDAIADRLHAAAMAVADHC